MKNLIYWLDEAKRVTGSDYKTAKIIGLSRQAVSQMRSGVHRPSNKICLKLAEILEVSPLEIIATVEMEKEPESAGHWAKYVGKVAAIFALAIIANFSFESTTYTESFVSNNYTLCALSKYTLKGGCHFCTTK